MPASCLGLLGYSAYPVFLVTTFQSFQVVVLSLRTLSTCGVCARTVSFWKISTGVRVSGRSLQSMQSAHRVRSCMRSCAGHCSAAGVVGHEGGIYFRCKWRAKLRRNAVVPGTACHVGRQELGLAMQGGTWVCWGASLAMCECFSDPQCYGCGVGRWEALHLGLCPLQGQGFGAARLLLSFIAYIIHVYSVHY